MSMSTHVVGFRTADEKWNEMRQVWNACESAGVPIPKEVWDYFDHDAPADKPGAEVKIDAAVKEWQDDSRCGYEVDLSKLPPDLTVIRFYNAY